MASKFIGVVIGVRSGEVKAVINPDSDFELDDPCWLQIRGGEDEAVKLVRTRRGKYRGEMSREDVAAILKKHRR